MAKAGSIAQAVDLGRTAGRQRQSPPEWLSTHPDPHTAIGELRSGRDLMPNTNRLETTAANRPALRRITLGFQSAAWPAHRDVFVPSPTFPAPRLSMTASVLRVLPKNALNAALTVLIGCAFAGGAFAQEDEDYKDTPKSSTMTGSAAAAAERARQRKAEAAKKANQQPELFPLATRKPPERKTSPKEVKAANEIQAAYDAKHMPMRSPRSTPPPPNRRMRICRATSISSPPMRGANRATRPRAPITTARRWTRMASTTTVTIRSCSISR